MKRFCFSADPERDADVIAFLEDQENMSAAFRQAVRLLMDENSDPNHALLLQILAEVLKRPVGTMTVAASDLSDEAHRKLSQLGRW